LVLLNEFGNLKWIILIAGIIGFTGLALFAIFGYILLIFYSISSIKEKLEKKLIWSILGTVFQFFMILGMTWPIPMLVIAIIAKLYFNFEIPLLY
jgi:hypothetical protein